MRAFIEGRAEEKRALNVLLPVIYSDKMHWKNLIFQEFQSCQIHNKKSALNGKCDQITL